MTHIYAPHPRPDETRTTATFPIYRSIGPRPPRCGQNIAWRSSSLIAAGIHIRRRQGPWQVVRGQETLYANHQKTERLLCPFPGLMRTPVKRRTNGRGLLATEIDAIALCMALPRQTRPDFQNLHHNLRLLLVLLLLLSSKSDDRCACRSRNGG